MAVSWVFFHRLLYCKEKPEKKQTALKNTGKKNSPNKVKKLCVKEALKESNNPLGSHILPFLDFKEGLFILISIGYYQKCNFKTSLYFCSHVFQHQIKLPIFNLKSPMSIILLPNL